MTGASAVLPQPDAPVDPAGTLCACGHRVEAHDRVAARYCAATTAGAVDRPCVCAPHPAAIARGARS